MTLRRTMLAAAVLGLAASAAQAGVSKIFYPGRVGSVNHCECFGYYPTAWRPWPCQPPHAAPAAQPAQLPPPMKVPEDEQASRRGGAPDAFRAVPASLTLPLAK